MVAKKQDDSSDERFVRDDPLVRVLVRTIAGVLVLVLTVALFLAYDSMARANGPRTLVDRQVVVMGDAATASPNNAFVQAEYVRALIASGDLERACTQLAAALPLSGEAPVLAVVQAQLLRFEGDDAGALAAADRLVARIREARKQEAKESSVRGTLGAPSAFRTELTQAELLRAGVWKARARYADAVDALTVALVEDPTMADVLAERGSLRLKLGDAASARRDFREALTLIPGYPPAARGLTASGG